MKRIIGLLFGCGLLLFIAPWIGRTPVADLTDFIFWQLRFPRVATGLMVGATLGITGAAFQALFGNPLATPSTTGTTAGATLGALTALVLLPPEWTNGRYTIIILAFAGALLVSLPVATLARRANFRMEDVLLAGIALTLAAGSLTTGLQFQADIAATYRAVQWSLGSLSQVGYQGTLLLLPFSVLACGGILWQSRALETLITGEEQAFSQGVNISRVRSSILFFGSLGVAATVAWCGPIAFVGLVVPHLVRLSLGNVRRILLPMSGVAGGTFLVLCDSIARTAFQSREMPVGVLTAAVGAPMLITLIFRRRSRSKG